MDLAIESSWKNVLGNELKKKYFAKLIQFVESEYANYPGAIFPDENQIFRAFNACSFDDVRVVILGQDPYPTKGHAHGLCFSCEAEVRPLPKSLKNIYKELNADIGLEISEIGDLNHWAEQGVLLLNATLTVREGEPESHANHGWEVFTDAVVNALNENKSNVVYMLWGGKAQRKAENVNRNNNLILTAPHPSPLSAYRGFFGSKHFSQCNNYLKESGLTQINW